MKRGKINQPEMDTGSEAQEAEGRAGHTTRKDI
jgi:hypothetical protein